MAGYIAPRMIKINGWQFRGPITGAEESITNYYSLSHHSPPPPRELSENYREASGGNKEESVQSSLESRHNKNILHPIGLGSAMNRFLGSNSAQISILTCLTESSSFLHFQL